MDFSFPGTNSKTADIRRDTGIVQYFRGKGADYL
jgi:hypothetical protein